MPSLERFVEQCRDAVRSGDGRKEVTEILREYLADVDGVMKELGPPEKAGLMPLFKADDLTIINVVWQPGMTIPPHNHEMWANIGIYSGREDNIFWRRIKDDPDGHIEAAGATALSAGEVAPLGKDIIHSVTNPIPRLTGAIHVYGGDFFEAERSEWDPEALEERKLDIEALKARFADN
ncbi:MULTISPECIES: hypothetical protein [Halocynthiibacter]|uniref:Metal-dependent protein of the double-stranded beta helix superfamily-like protein n=1 Tax=Halocynthiibacter halioticoli TaxID=2986804 RepID=A0AAE3LQB7_9RHOB|nr:MULTISPECIES: hypothetical protein [Halocynthiibacter]MCV6823318.1 hypothetical protein [Halocynthiibacter halioticoli]MCW4056319.1 hypothetical protein [Halocynthiibacter sp. SDUM655004]